MEAAAWTDLRLWRYWKAASTSRIIIRRLPGFDESERQMRLSGYQKPFPSACDDAADVFLKRNFGLTWDETFLPTSISDAAELDYERQIFVFDGMPEVEVVAYLLTLRIDLRDARGNPLKCTELIARPCEVVAKGLAGKLPELGYTA